MSEQRDAGRCSRACAQCLRRSWLLDALSWPLEYSSRREGRLEELLALGDRQLLGALGGRRRAELEDRYVHWEPAQMRPAGVEALCRHDRDFPATLRRHDGPRVLHLAPGVPRLIELSGNPLVAIIGSRRASDYGVQTAKDLARGLGASGVTVASDLSDGIAAAAQIGAHETATGSLVAMAGGPDVPTPARRLALYEALKRSGCVLSELPNGSPPRRWGAAASELLVAELASVTVVVEAGDDWRELAAARFAQALGRPVAAVPGRVSSPTSRGTHALLLGGARLVQSAADVLDLLSEAGQEAPRPVPFAGELSPLLRETLERVAAGSDTHEKLLGNCRDAGELLLALSELELIGLLGRGEGGRYVPTQGP